MKKINILIVDDHWLAQHMLSLILVDYAAICDCVDSAALALQAIKTQVYDLILIDLGLPDFNGFELAQKLRAAGSVSTFVALTSQLDPSYQQHPQQTLFAGFIEKPLTEESYVKGLVLPEFMSSLMVGA